jgi:hypothetical protein
MDIGLQTDVGLPVRSSRSLFRNIHMSSGRYTDV